MASSKNKKERKIQVIKPGLKDVAGVSYIATTGSSQVTIQGLSNGRQGQIIFFLNSAGVDVAFQHENGNASTGDQIRTPNGVTWWLGVDANAEYDACILQYHGDYWFIFGATDLGYNT